MRRGFALALFVLLASVTLPAAMRTGDVSAQQMERQSQDSRPADTVPAQRLARLRRGVNLSNWFAQSPRGDYSEAHLKTYITGRDAALIKSLGFDHVRFTVEPAPLMDGRDPSRLQSEYLARLDAALDMLMASGLAVVVDIHPTDEFKIRLRTDDSAVAAFAAFWRSLAAHLSARDPERLFLEILNEPMVEDASRWMEIQSRLAGVIRGAAPRHTIIATGARWSAIDQLLLLEPLADRNVIYSFHFYEPHNFTHQGANWGDPLWPYLKGVPYPSAPELVNDLLPAVENEQARAALRFYGEERWGALRVEKEIAAAAGWARRHGVSLVCGEFGVYRLYAPEDARLRWMVDVRTALERHGIGWTLWDYAGAFGLVMKKEGAAAVTVDPRTVTALGLQRTVQ